MSGMISKNIFLALLLSLIVTFLFAIVYAFFPLISAMLSDVFRSPRSGGITAVAGGVSKSFFLMWLFIEPILFLIIFSWLQRRR
jgi:hypothetical protein